MKLLMILADDFEDTEAISTFDVLCRGGDQVDQLSLMGRKNLFPKYSKEYIVNYTTNNINFSDYDGVIIPGGPGAFKIMPNLEMVENIIRYFADNKKMVAAICAAPFLIGRLGYFKNLNYTVHPGFEDKIIGGNYLRDKGVVVSNNFITAKSMYYSIEFALEIHKYFHGENSANSLKKSCQGE